MLQLNTYDLFMLLCIVVGSRLCCDNKFLIDINVDLMKYYILCDTELLRQPLYQLPKAISESDSWNYYVKFRVKLQELGPSYRNRALAHHIIHPN